MSVNARETCWRCRRPVVTCWCAQLPSLVTTKTRVVFVQHPRERDVAIGTARMAHLALPGSRLIEGLAIDEQLAKVDDVFAAADDENAAGHCALLFPGEGARPLSDWLQQPPRVLIVVDGTWSQARKLLRLNPRLAALPRLSYDPPEPGNYRIRREPSDKHLSTIEATAAVLGLLEGDPARFATMLHPFSLMVDRQLAAVVERGRRRHVRSRRSSPLPELEALDPERAVVCYAEANCHPQQDRAAGAPELVHLVASRPLSSSAASAASSFAAVLRPRRVLHESVAPRLGLTQQMLEEGEDVDVVLRRFRAFVGDGTLVCWGSFARDLLVQEGEPRRGFVDLRALVARTRQRAAGGVERAAHELGVVVNVDANAARAERMHAGIAGLLLELHTRLQALTQSKDADTTD